LDEQIIDEPLLAPASLVPDTPDPVSDVSTNEQDQSDSETIRDPERTPDPSTSLGWSKPEVDAFDLERQAKIVRAGISGGPREPARLEHYELLDVLGRGGMGVVHAARDLKLNRKVAIKRLLAHRGDAFRSRFVREAQAMAQLSHPNIVPIHAIGQDGDVAFIDMEYVDGVTLRRWLQDSPRSVAEIVGVFTAAGHGLVAVHSKGLVHRDFKPDNVMVGNDGRVRVMDFGLAGADPHHEDTTVLADQVRGPVLITQTGAVIGTLAYMAPEQLDGRRADAKSDQFAYCVSLHEALYGERPFPGATPEQLLAAIEQGRIPAAPMHSKVPAALREVVLRGLQPQPDERFETMQALLDALQASVLGSRDPPKYVFVAHDNRDKLAVLNLCESLLDHGVRPWLDIWDIRPDDEPLARMRKALLGAPAVLVCHGQSWDERHYEAADALRERIAADPSSVYRVSLSDSSPAGVLELARRIGVDSDRASWLDDEADRAGLASRELSPYRGLKAFLERDARWMFGRAEETARLLDSVRADSTRFLTVIGASGSGKSSLVMAGVCPALRNGVIGGRVWTIAWLRPRARPCESLARVLVGLEAAREPRSDPSVDATLVARLREQLLDDENTLKVVSQRIAHAKHGEQGKLLLVVDQLEELFTEARLGHEGASLEALAFVRNVLAATERSGVLWVMATLRGDFLKPCLEVGELAPALQLGIQIALPPMRDSQLRAAILRPVQRVGFDMDPNLVTALVVAAAGQAGRLPLLQHVLRELWHLRDTTRRELTYEVYAETGGLESAIAKAAEQALGSLDARGQQLTRQVMTRLVHLGEGDAGHTRRSASMSELGGKDEIQPVLDAFVGGARVLVADDVAGTEVVEIAHEALLREWTTLVAWLSADRDGIRLRQELGSDAEKRRQATGRRLAINREYLWGEARVEEAKRVLAASTVELNELERAFLDESHRRARRRRWLARISRAAVTLAALIVAVVVLEKNRQIASQLETLEAKDERVTAELRIQQGQRASMLAKDPGNELAALTLAIESFAHFDITAMPSPVFSGLTSALMAIEAGIPLQGHGNWVVAVAFSPDGARLATASRDKIIWWDANSGARLHVLDGHEPELNAVALSPDGTQFASTCADDSVRIRDAETGKQFTKIKHKVGGRMTDLMLDAAFSPNGVHLATAGRDGRTRVWDIATGEMRQLFPHAGAVRMLAFSPDGKQLASVSDDKTIRMWDRSTGTAIRILHGHAGKIYAVTFSSDGTRLASGSDDGTARIWDAATGQQISTPLVHDRDVVRAVAFSHDGKQLATGTFDDNAAHVWDVATSKHLRSFRHAGPVVDVAFSPNGKQLATASWDQTARSWNLDESPALATLEGHTQGVYAVASSPDGTRIATGSGDDTGRLWDATTGAPLAILRGHRHDLSAVVFSFDGKLLATASWDGGVQLWDGKSGAPIRALQGHEGRVNAVAFSPDGSRIATAGEDKSVRVWDSSTGDAAWLPLLHEDAVIDVMFSPDGKQLLAITETNAAQVWDVSTMQPSAFSYDRPVTAVAFSPNRPFIAIATKEHELFLWDPHTGVVVRSFAGHIAVVDVVFSNDGALLATASEDGTARVWDVKTGDEIVAFPHPGDVVGVAFTSDGARLATASGDAVARVWMLDPRPWLEWGCAVLDGRRAHVDATRDACRAIPMTATASESGRTDLGEPSVEEVAGIEPEVITVHGMELVRIPGGTFWMGSPKGLGSGDEQPHHEVELDSFYMARTEVTNAQYALYLEANPSAWEHAGFRHDHGGYVVPEFYRQPELPAVYVRLDSAKTYCEWAGLVLPTEAQWEYAARANANSTTAYWFGDDVHDLGRFAWFADNSGDRPHRVATKGANAFGLHDMAGNVSEWVLDAYTNSYYPGRRDGDGLLQLSTGKGVYRGGDWQHGADFARSGVRHGFPVDYSEEYLGFRCARGIP
jgi:WD40 repeat protein/formylglycine-generating enzyme required for sulfatase activity/serine/threonine protein kinase